MKPRTSRLRASALEKLLRYDPETGLFAWRVTHRRVAAGDRAGSAMSDGYWRIKIAGTAHKAHRLAWLCYYGVWPDRPVQHINGDRSDNRIANLKLRD